MGRIRGFYLKNRVKTIFRQTFSPAIYRRLIRWTRRLRSKANAIAAKNKKPGRGYIRVGQDPTRPDYVPKGRMAVYVGNKDGDVQRILVPVVYFNHPMFGDLLRESEKEYGFDQPGGLTIPCRISEFERVQTRIESGRCTQKLMKW